MRQSILAAMLLCALPLNHTAFASVEKPAVLPKASSAPVRLFVMDFGEKVRVGRSIFKMSIDGHEPSLLDFDRTEELASKIAVFVPQNIVGKMTITWAVVNQQGEISKGTMNLNQE